MNDLQTRIEEVFEGRELTQSEFAALFQEFLDGLNHGKIRAAEPWRGDWKVNTWVKKGILLGFRQGKIHDFSINRDFRYFDKSTFPLRPTEQEENVRIVPGGSSVRTGSHVASGVVIMPPAYVNVGAYVGEGTMIDSHALVGSCAQIGSRVHLSAGTQIGGVLEPIGASPVIIEDQVMIGGNCGIYEGTRVSRGAVVGAGTILTASIPVYDLVSERVLRASGEERLIIPENAVVVPGTRPLKTRTHFAGDLHLACAVIVKYRDQKTDAATALESALR